MKTSRKAFSLLLVLCLVIAGALGSPSTSQAAASSSSVYNAVKDAYGSSYPLSDSNMIKTERKDVFGNYSEVLGVSAKLFSEYTAAKKSSSEEEYMSFICKATSNKNVKKIKKKLKLIVLNEYKSNINYHSDHCNTLLKNAKVGSKGSFVYLFVLDTEGNAKAINAFKESLS